MKVINFRSTGRCYYYDSLEKEFQDTDLMKGVKSSNDFINKYSLSEDDYLYARQDTKTGKWKDKGKKMISTKYDKFFVSCEFADEEIIPGLKLKEKKEYPARPPLLHLSDDECFLDEEGERLDIQVVGERDVEMVYFRLKDVSCAFEIKNLYQTVTNAHKHGYLEGKHYRMFCSTSTTLGNKAVQAECYLTYWGILRVLIASRSPISEPFIKWANKILFTAQMGTKAQKRKLAAHLTGLDLEAIKNMNKATSGKISCIYLFSLGTVKALRETLEIPDEYEDDEVVYKYGRTGELDKRAAQHQKTYGKMRGADLVLAYHAYVDPKYESQAETTISHTLAAMDLSYDYGSHKELIIVPKHKYEMIKEQYDFVSKKYRGSVREVIAEMEKLEHKYMLELARKDIEIANAQSEVMVARKDAELSEKDNEILRLKLQIAEMKNWPWFD